MAITNQIHREGVGDVSVGELVGAEVRGIVGAVGVESDSGSGLGSGLSSESGLDSGLGSGSGSSSGSGSGLGSGSGAGASVDAPQTHTPSVYTWTSTAPQSGQIPSVP